jgi:cobyrinic acid a,c-diamide synthase
MGLVPHLESAYASRAIEWVQEVVERHLDLEALWAIAQKAKPVERIPYAGEDKVTPLTGAVRPRIGVIKDKAFWFYYPENLENLQRLGALLVDVNSMMDKTLPEVDALYIGGGFPETQVQALSDNRSFRLNLKKRIDDGLPVYAECGGLMYLGEDLMVDNRIYPMVGALPMDVVLEKRPQGHGYTVLEVTDPNPYYEVGEVLRGHEFHYSKAIFKGAEQVTPVFKVRRGWGIDGERDGLCKRNLLATYTHLHAGGDAPWAKALYRVALHSAWKREGIISDYQKKRD